MVLVAVALAMTASAQTRPTLRPRPTPTGTPTTTVARVPNTGGYFSTEEDFVTRGPTPPDGNRIISDGDLLTPTGQVYMRNADLLRRFKTGEDLGLDAADVISPDKHQVVFSTELDHPDGLFTAGDLLTTDGGVLPNAALLAAFRLRNRADLGLDAVQMIGQRDKIDIRINGNLAHVCTAADRQADNYILWREFYITDGISLGINSNEAHIFL